MRKYRLTVSGCLRTDGRARRPDTQGRVRAAAHGAEGCRRARGGAAGEPTGRLAAPPGPAAGRPRHSGARRDAARLPRRPARARRAARVLRRLLEDRPRRLQAGGRAVTDEHGEGNMETTTDLAIRKTIHVDASPERAFEVFTRRIGSWWPLETHSPGAMLGTPPAELHLEPREGGRFYEVGDGQERSWGRVLACDPPRRVVIEWNVNP